MSLHYFYIKFEKGNFVFARAVHVHSIFAKDTFFHMLPSLDATTEVTSSLDFCSFQRDRWPWNSLPVTMMLPL